MELTSLLDHYFEEYTTEEQKRNAVDFFKCFPYRQVYDNELLLKKIFLNMEYDLFNF